MYSSIVVKLRPQTPWRIGPASGSRSQTDSVFHSDSLYSAVTLAMESLGWMEEWLAATAANPEGAPVRFSSCFPFAEDTLLIAPPRNLWPPPPSARLRWKAARYVPMHVVETLLKEERLRDDDGSWVIDAGSECMLPSRSGRWRPPFRVAVRHTAAVDRITGVSAEPAASACLEFTPGAGFWCAVVFCNDEARETWAKRIEACFRLLADTGFGGERSRGWGRAAAPEFQYGRFPGRLFRLPAAAAEPATAAEGEEAPAAEPAPAPAETAYWLWSLFAPAASDQVDWQRGAYTLIPRGGRTHGAGELKKNMRLVCEGSVLFAGSALTGAAANVAPDSAPHPVYRSGFALAVPIPWRVAV